ncbi:related to arylamine N-acetyltransferase [Cephalotrichum gorgonifer]|uniref:Related to arylamine N-acetyltransferase n=1 Tax=Cephalotrichum gorgonifer TaxID=2041049 RepID=A0AAE8N6X1_9PEZI|nr:related to arylamine N-acetyltransferase [Cephalotrichum gorgonifer]
MDPSIFKEVTPQLPNSYSPEQVSKWLARIRLPEWLRQHVHDHQDFPRTAESLCALMRCQITTFPYENLSVHYSSTHLVDIHPEVLYEKLMGASNGGRGGYCMELSIFFHHMLRGLGFRVYMTGVRNRRRTDGVPGGEFRGWTHITNIVYLPSGEKFAVDAAFGGDGPTSPLPLNDSGTPIHNLGTQQVRLVHETLAKQQLASPKVWIYQYRNGVDKEWNSFYCFAEIEFFQEDFEVMNVWGSMRTLHRWTVLVVRFLREGDSPLVAEGNGDVGTRSTVGIEVVGKVMLVNDVVKVNMGGKTEVVRKFDSEEGRVQALRDYFGIELTGDQQLAIQGWDMALG